MHTDIISADMPAIHRKVREFRAMSPEVREQPQTLLAFMPAYARMDTLEQKSLESREIARLFRRARAHLGHAGINNGVYLAALAATLQNMEEQIYEHFRSVEDLLVEGARAWLDSGALADPLSLYAIQTGIEEHWLDPERYGPALERALLLLSPQGNGRAVVLEAAERSQL
jgi:AcrR family transcriptional regulator